MKSWMLLALILPAGLMVGLIGARLADPATLRKGEQAADAAALAAPDLAYAEAGADAWHAPSDEADPPERDARPDLDWNDEFWPGDHHGVSTGPYDYDGDYYGEDVSAFGSALDDAADGYAPSYTQRAAQGQGAGVGRGEAAEAAFAAERAARDALQTAAEAASGTPAPPVHTGSTATALPEPQREPRTADGDLPAIW
jgi:hypothetical protein